MTFLISGLPAANHAAMNRVPFCDTRELYQVSSNGLQALVRERIKDWGAGLCKSLGKKLVELTGVLQL